MKPPPSYGDLKLGMEQSVENEYEFEPVHLPDFLVRFISGGTREVSSFRIYFLSPKNLHPVANSSNKETNSTDFLTWSWHMSIIFGWQANISQTSSQSTEFRHLGCTFLTAAELEFKWFICFVLFRWICFPTFFAPDITVDVSKKRRKMWETPGGGCCKPWNLIIFPRVIVFLLSNYFTSYIHRFCLSRVSFLMFASCLKKSFDLGFRFLDFLVCASSQP